jgi:carbamoyltransferase
MLYELVTAILGYDLMDSGKTMGLSSHGVPRYLDVFEEFTAYGNEVTNCFTSATDDPRFKIAIEQILVDGRCGFTVKADLAASVQTLVNKTLLHCEQFFYGREIEYLCLVGGCALNAVANTFLVEHSKLNVTVVVPPHSDDAGLCFGALWLDRFARSRSVPELTFRESHPSPALSRPGRVYTRDECRNAVQAFYPRLSLDPAISSAGDVARAIAEGAIVGVFCGRSEIGPRALGGRSIIADPRLSITRERINRLIKRREPFRPLAPMVLRSRYEDYFFDARCADHFMLKVARVRDRCLHEAPAVVHVDGTARVQVIEDDGDPFLVELLNHFTAAVGVGILLNTSFNRRGEPIVESPADAIDAFLGMGLDGLYLDGEFYRPVESASLSS